MVFTVDTMEKFLFISAGAVLGANARYWLSGWAAEKFGTSYPYGTLLVNLSGSFVMGLFVTLLTERFILDPNWRLFIVIGFLGAYTTFSTYTYESINLLMAGQIMPGLFNLVGSSLLGLVAVVAGILLGRAI